MFISSPSSPNKEKSIKFICTIVYSIRSIAYNGIKRKLQWEISILVSKDFPTSENWSRLHCSLEKRLLRRASPECLVYFWDWPSTKSPPSSFFWPLAKWRGTQGMWKSITKYHWKLYFSQVFSYLITFNQVLFGLSLNLVLCLNVLA